MKRTTLPIHLVMGLRELPLAGGGRVFNPYAEAHPAPHLESWSPFDALAAWLAPRTKAAFEAIAGAWRRDRDRRAAIRELRRLGPRMLRDIGIDPRRLPETVESMMARRDAVVLASIHRLPTPARRSRREMPKAA